MQAVVQDVVVTGLVTDDLQHGAGQVGALAEARQVAAQVIADRETGEGILNALVEVGQRVAVIGLKGVDAFRSQKGLGYAGPRYFGFDIDYVPIEEAIKKC